MNILFISGQYPPNTKGGGEISTHKIAKGLVTAGHTITVVTEGDRVDTTQDGVKVMRMPLGLTDKPLLESLKSRQIAKTIIDHVKIDRFDFVHAHDFRSALVVAHLLKIGALKPSQAAVTLRDYASISGDTNYILSDSTIPKRPGSVHSAWKSYRIAEAGIVQKIGRFLQYILNTGYRTESFSRIPNRVYISHAQHREITKFLKPSKNEQVIYNPVLVPEEVSPLQEMVVTYVGRIETYKGIGVLYEAWKSIVSHIPTAKLVLVGEGAQKEALQAAVVKDGLDTSVEFRSFVPHEEMNSMYQASTIVVAPNLWIEPFGRSVAEGMAAGRIVVASNTGGPGEILTNKQTGYICKRGSVEDLTIKILEILTMDDSDRAQIGVQAREWVSINLNPNKIAQQYADFYLQIRSKAR